MYLYIPIFNFNLFMIWIDVAVDYWENFIFISDSDGRIHRRTIDPANLTLATSEVLYTNQSTAPTKLDVDWLNEQLFFVQGTEVDNVYHGHEYSYFSAILKNYVLKSM